MDDREYEKIWEIVFERMVAGESGEHLHAQLSGRLTPEEADRVIADARNRIEQGRGSNKFERQLRKIRKRRLVAHRFIAWKAIAGFSIFMSLLSFLSSLGPPFRLNGSIGGLLIGAIILVYVEWREEQIIRQPTDQPTGS